MPSLIIKSPVGGVNRVVQREGQPPDTCWDASNILPFDRYGRKRISQRHGLVKEYATQLSSTNKIQGMLPVNSITYNATVQSTITTPVSGFTNVPATVSTSGNSISFPAGWSSNISNTGPQWTGSLPAGNYTLAFDITTNMSADNHDQPVVWARIDTAPGSLFNIVTTSRLSATFTIKMGGDPATELVIHSSTTTDYTYDSVSPVLTTGVAFHNSLTWNASNQVSGVMGGASTDYNAIAPYTNGFITVNPPAPILSFFSQVGDSSTTISLSNINVTTTSTVSTGGIGYITQLIAVADGFVWVGDSNGNIAKAAHGQATPLLSSTHLVSLCYANGVVFIVDGTTCVAYTVATDTVALASTLVTRGTMPTNCSLIANWRGRIVMAGDSNNPQLVYFSRPSMTLSTGTFYGPGADWDYSQTDPAAAFTSNQGSAGQIGEPVTALIPFTDDLLKVGCSRSLWMYQGDPADGGSIVKVSDQIGIVYKDAWCVNPAGELFFVGTGGLFRVRPAWEFYRPAEAITHQTINQNFTQLSPGITQTTLVYDPDLHYLHVFISAPPISGTLGQHLTLDARSLEGQTPPAFWPQTFPSTMGPACSCYFFADGTPTGRTILLGGNDGYIRAWKLSAYDDDGSTTTSNITLGPYPLGPDQDAAIVNGVTIDMGETPIGLSSTNFQCVVKLAAGPDAYSATQDLPSGTHLRAVPNINVILDRRQTTFRQRMRGAWFTINLATVGTDTTYSFESARIDYVPGGRNRERRQ